MIKKEEMSRQDSLTNGSESICRTLEALGANCFFSIPGSQNVVLFEALRTAKLRTVVATSEMNAAFAACGYARASGRVGVLSTIPGPGFVYAIPAIVEARQDSAALLWIALSVEADGKPFYFQDIPQLELAKPIVKKILRVASAQELPTIIAAGYDETQVGEPGPVLIDVPVRVLQEEVVFQPPVLPTRERTKPVRAASEVAARLAKSSRPLIYAGQGAADGGNLVKLFAEALNCPVLTTCSGRGVLPEDHPLSFYSDLSFGVGGATAELIHQSDLILALGCKFTHNGTGGFQLQLSGDKLIQVDCALENLGATFKTKDTFEFEVASFLSSLWEMRDVFLAPNGTNRSSWDSAYLKEHRLKLLAELTRPIRGEPKMHGAKSGSTRDLFSAVREIYPRDTIFVTDSGMHQALARQYATIFKPRSMICPADFQSMGLGIPGAIGARLSRSTSEVIAVVGDGAFLMTATDLLSAIREKLSLTVFVFNDSSLGRIRLQQLEKFGRESGVELLNPDFELFAQSIGATYFRAEGDLNELCRLVLNTSGVRIVEVLLGDSMALRATRAKSVARETVRDIFGQRFIQLAKRILKRY